MSTAAEVLRMKREWESRKESAIEELLAKRKEIDDQLAELGHVQVSIPREESTESVRRTKPHSLETRLKQRAQWSIRKGSEKGYRGQDLLKLMNEADQSDPDYVAIFREPDKFRDSVVETLIKQGSTGFSERRKKASSEAE